MKHEHVDGMIVGICDQQVGSATTDADLHVDRPPPNRKQELESEYVRISTKK